MEQLRQEHRERQKQRKRGGRLRRALLSPKGEPWLKGRKMPPFPLRKVYEAITDHILCRPEILTSPA
jgi:hypothetical protein